MKLSIITVVASLFAMTVLSGCSNNASRQNVADAEIKDQVVFDEKEKNESTYASDKHAETSFVKENPEKDKAEISKNEDKPYKDAYTAKVGELEGEYGEISDVLYFDEVFYLKCCFFDLVDFNNDGSDELIAICYSPADEATPYTYDYCLFIYRNDDGELKRVFKHHGLYENSNTDISGIMACSTITEVDGIKYFVLSDEDGEYTHEKMYYTLEEDSFVCKKSLAYSGDIFDGDVEHYVDGNSISSEKYDELSRAWDRNNAYYYLSDLNMASVSMAQHHSKKIRQMIFDGEISGHKPEITKKQYTNEELIAQIQDFTDDELRDEPIVADFDGDGREEMVCQAGAIDNSDGRDFWKMYFIYTDGENTYSFGEIREAFLYKVHPYLIPVGNGFHFAACSEWRNYIIDGYICYSEIYGLTPYGDEEYMNAPFCEISNPGVETIQIVYHEEATPGAIPITAFELKWNGHGDYWNDRAIDLDQIDLIRESN